MSGAAFIEARGLSKSFPAPDGAHHVLRHVALEVQRGEFVAILGAMGSGKSTLLSILAGLTAADAGTVTIDGEPVRGIRNDASFVFQGYSLLPWFTALENVRLAIGSAFPELPREAQRERARRALEKVGLANAMARRPGQLSGGMRQRVAIARALATEPKVLFLDEPFGALDALTRDTLQQELARLCAEGDPLVTTIMITNSVDEAILLADRIVPVIPGPPATLGPAVPVALRRPRTVNQLAHDDQAIHVRGQIVTALTEALRATRARAGRTVQAPGAATSALGMMPTIVAAAEEPR